MSELNRLSLSASANLRSFALAGSIKRGDPTALVQFERELSVIADATHAGLVLESKELFFRTPAPEAVAALGRLATGNSELPTLSRAATFALRAMRTDTSLEYLAQLLDSTDARVR